MFWLWKIGKGLDKVYVCTYIASARIILNEEARNSVKYVSELKTEHEMF